MKKNKSEVFPKVMVCLMAGVFFCVGWGGLIWQGVTCLRVRDWVQVDGTVLSSSLKMGHSSSKHGSRTVYRPKMVYEYSYQGTRHQGDKYSNFDLSSSSYRAEKAKTERHKPGASVRVWVNPDRPQESVLERRLWPPYFMMVFFAMFAATGTFLMVLAVRMLFGEKQADVASKAMSDVSSMALSDVSSMTMPDVASRAMSDVSSMAMSEAAPSSKAMFMRPLKSSMPAEMKKLLFFAVVWNLFISMFVSLLLANAGEGDCLQWSDIIPKRWSDVIPKQWSDVIPTLFVGVFMAVGLELLVKALWRLWTFFHRPRVEVVVTCAALRSGEEMQVNYTFDGDAGIKRLEVEVTSVNMDFRQLKPNDPDPAEGITQEVYDSDCRGGVSSMGSFSFKLPNVPPSKRRWSLVLTTTDSCSRIVSTEYHLG